MVDNPLVGVVIVILASILLFAPTIVAHFRKLRAFRSVSALNALTFLFVAGFAVPSFLFWGLLPLVVWTSTVIWVIATVWALVGRGHDS